MTDRNQSETEVRGRPICRNGSHEWCQGDVSDVLYHDRFRPVRETLWECTWCGARQIETKELLV